MRIALVNSIRSYGGGEKRLLRGAYEFRRRGHTVLTVAGPDAELQSRCAGEGVPAAAVAFHRYYSPRTFLPLAGTLRAFRPDAVVTYDERAVRAAGLAVRLLGARPPALVHYHGLEGAFKNKPYNRLVVAPRVARFVPNAAALGEELAGFGWIPRARIHVIYDGVDMAPIDAADPAGVREELGCAPEDVVALVVARLVPEKGHAFLIDSLADLPQRFPALRFWVAGEGPEAAPLEALLRERRLEACVRLLGFRRDVPRLLRAADLLCHPSRREGAPNAVREAMAAGLPVVAVAASGTPELLDAGRTGFLVPIGDAATLRESLARLAADPALRRGMGAAGREKARAEFSEERCAERWLELLEECRR